MSVWRCRVGFFVGVVSAALAGGASFARAEDVVKVGAILALTGDGASLGQHMQQAINLYTKMHKADLPSGTRLDIIVRDDGSKPDNTRRLAQELVVRDHVNMIAGIVLSPQGFAVAPVLTEAKVPGILFNATTGSITRSSPYIVRFSHSNWQMAYTVGQWAAKNGIKNAYSIVADYAAGLDMDAAFKRGFTDGGGTIVGFDKTPLNTTDYLPYMQRIKAAKPQSVFIFEISGPATIAFYKAWSDAGLTAAGVTPLGTGDIVADDQIQQTGPAAIGTITGSVYATTIDNPFNKALIKAWKAEYGAETEPSFESVATWNGMAAIYGAVKKLGAKATGDAAMDFFKTYKSDDAPQGPISIDPETRDIIQDVYLCKVEKKAIYVNEPFDRVKDVKDAWKILNPAP